MDQTGKHERDSMNVIERDFKHQSLLNNNSSIMVINNESCFENKKEKDLYTYS